MVSLNDYITPDDRERSKLFADFVDILFGVVIGASFVFQSSSAGVPSWAANISGNLVTLGDAILSYSLVVTSWIGWHQSIKTLPTLNAGRFVIDILLLFFYYLAFINVSSFSTTLIILTVVFFLYFLWNAIRYSEYPEDVRKDHKIGQRTIESLGFSIIFAFIWYVATGFPSTLLQGAGLGFLFIVCGGLLAVYRRNFLRGRIRKTRVSYSQKFSQN